MPGCGAASDALTSLCCPGNVWNAQNSTGLSADCGQEVICLPEVSEDLAFCTIVSKNYLAQARVLAESVRHHHPHAPFFALLVDRVDGYFEPAEEPFTLVGLQELAIADLPRLCFQYTIKELNAAAKPHFLSHLLCDRGLDKVVYLDPDILVLADFRRLSGLLERYGFVITPHLTEPLDDDRKPAESDILKSGVYNLGFIALRRHSHVLEFLKWWQRRVDTGCTFEPENGSFADQRWIDLLPGFRDDVHILRDPSYNVAYWNLATRPLSLDGTRVLAKGVPCRFVHFSGFDPLRPHHISKHQDRFSMADLGEGRHVYELYAKKLLERGYAQCRRWPYAFDSYQDGTPIALLERRACLNWTRDDGPMGNPFVKAGEDSFYCRVLGGNKALPFGLNLVGYFRSHKGIGQMARGVLTAVRASGLPFTVVNWEDLSSKHRETAPPEAGQHPAYRINLIMINAEQVAEFLAERPNFCKGRYNIALWNWETEGFPHTRWPGCFAPFDEIWVPSAHTQDAIAAVSPVPVRRVPGCVEVEVDSRAAAGDRARFGIPQEAVVFLFAFDFHSYFERKNPLATIAAFCKAFKDDDDAVLVVKTIHGDDAPYYLEEMKSACADRRRIIFLDQALGRQEMYALTGCCDCFVSLHRAEGFGLHLAEAMALGKCVITTDYSGSKDFVSVSNALPVAFEVVSMAQDHGPYPKGTRWAEPDIAHAAEQMRRAFDDAELRRRLGEKARATVAAELSPQQVGARIRLLLERARVTAEAGADRPLATSAPGRAVGALKRLADRVLANLAIESADPLVEQLQHNHRLVLDELARVREILHSAPGVHVPPSSPSATRPLRNKVSAFRYLAGRRRTLTGGLLANFVDPVLREIDRNQDAILTECKNLANEQESRAAKEVEIPATRPS